MKIPNNTMMRNKAIKRIEKKEGGIVPIEPFPDETEHWEEQYKKRLNQNLRNRLQTMLSYNEIRLEDVGDFLSLLEERLNVEDMFLETALKTKERLDDEYGSYSKRYTTIAELKTKADCGYLVHEHKHILNDKERKNLGMPLTEGQKEKKWQKKHKKKSKKFEPFL